MACLDTSGLLALELSFGLRKNIENEVGCGRVAME
jgi:hypothetical protein